MGNVKGSSPDEIWRKIIQIHSDFAGLTVKRDQFNGKTRLRATGKIGGGGEKVELYTEDGEIQIEQQGVAH